METPIAEEYPELFHYTGISGLEGILKNQTLWATHASFLNDPMELKEFKVKLSRILRPMLESCIAELVKIPADREIIKQIGGEAKFLEKFMTDTVGGMYDTVLGTQDEPACTEFYIASFCTAEKEQITQHGLLSQWRGYGQEGGYAIVFDTARLDNSLKQEAGKWGPEYALFCGNVVYSNVPDKKIRDELGEDIDILLDNFCEYLRTESRQYLVNIYNPLIRCACRYKHWGFHEEKEVRIIAIPPNKEVFNEVVEEQKAKGLLANKKERHHFVRGGTPVPCIHLFDGITQLPGTHLPITRIIVGPHRDKDKRREAVEILLSQYQLDIPVAVSEIPYVGNF